MRNGGIRNVVLGAVILAAAGGLWAADHYRVVNGPKDFYFGHISYIEPVPDGTDPVVLREGRAEPEQGGPEPADRARRYDPDVGRPALRDPIRLRGRSSGSMSRPRSASRRSWPGA